MQEKKIKILGMMSGTSGDGIDGALVEFHGRNEFRLLWHDSFAFTDNVRQRIRSLMHRPALWEALLGESYVAQLYAEACSQFFATNQEKPDYIAAHGQTILHIPQLTDWDGYIVNGSMQLLAGSMLALKTGIPVICNFREADMAALGQGAPLVPFADAIFFGHNLQRERIILNIGGIANITVLKPCPGGATVSCAFDTGPGNMMMDALMELESGGSEHYDKDGAVAATAEPDLQLTAHFLQDRYFSEKPPKSTGREKFGESALHLFLSRFDAEATLAKKMSTLLEITVQSIVDAILDPELQIPFPVELVVAGGGALNRELMRRLREKLAGKCSVHSSDEFAVPVMAREAMAFAALGSAFLRGEPANVVSATGADHAVVLGQLHPVPIRQNQSA